MSHVRSESDATIIRRELMPLLSGKIIAVEMVREDESGWSEWWPTIIVRQKDGMELQIVVSQDEEGNGPGHLFIEPAGDPGPES